LSEQKLKVVLSHRCREQFITELRAEFPQVDFRLGFTPRDQAREAVDADVIWGVLYREGFLAAKKLRWFCYLGIGVDSMFKLTPELPNSDLTMTYSRGPHVIAMAEYAFGMILAFAHRLRDSFEDQRNHVWDTGKYHRTIGELAGSTLGILAFGDIGRAVARRAAGFDMDVVAVDLAPTAAPQGVRAVWGMDRLDEMLATSDWIVVTAPWTPQTAGLVDRERMAKIKRGAHLVVVSRGGVVDEGALIDALRSGQVAGAALDALADEPPPDDHPLWDLPNAIVTAHTSAESAENYDRRGEIFKQNLRRYLAGEPLMYVVDKGRGY
jgi:phosphoglycerate dehydrogenase-like enzyme